MKKWVTLLLSGVFLMGGLWWYGVSGERYDETQSFLSLDVSSIEKLTQEDKVIHYLHENRRLPDYYMTKKQAREKGWNAKEGNLCRVAPNRAIGGDRFANRQKQLPERRNRVWREADINYQCGHRGPARVLYSDDGLIYITRDHYRHFTQVE